MGGRAGLERAALAFRESVGRFGHHFAVLHDLRADPDRVAVAHVSEHDIVMRARLLVHVDHGIGRVMGRANV